MLELISEYSWILILIVANGLAYWYQDYNFRHDNNPFLRGFKGLLIFLATLILSTGYILGRFL